MRMLGGRGRIRGLVMQLNDEVVRQNVRAQAVNELTDRLEAHFALEDLVVFPLFDHILPQKALEEMYDQLATFDAARASSTASPPVASPTLPPLDPVTVRAARCTSTPPPSGVPKTLARLAPDSARSHSVTCYGAPSRGGACAASRRTLDHIQPKRAPSPSSTTTRPTMGPSTGMALKTTYRTRPTNRDKTRPAGRFGRVRPKSNRPARKLTTIWAR